MFLFTRKNVSATVPTTATVSVDLGKSKEVVAKLTRNLKSSEATLAQTLAQNDRYAAENEKLKMELQMLNEELYKANQKNERSQQLIESLLNNPASNSSHLEPSEFQQIPYNTRIQSDDGSLYDMPNTFNNMEPDYSRFNNNNNSNNSNTILCEQNEVLPFFGTKENTRCFQNSSLSIPLVVDTKNNEKSGVRGYKPHSGTVVKLPPREHSPRCSLVSSVDELSILEPKNLKGTNSTNKNTKVVRFENSKKPAQFVSSVYYGQKPNESENNRFSFTVGCSDNGKFSNSVSANYFGNEETEHNRFTFPVDCANEGVKERQPNPFSSTTVTSNKGGRNPFSPSTSTRKNAWSDAWSDA